MAPISRMSLEEALIQNLANINFVLASCTQICVLLNAPLASTLKIFMGSIIKHAIGSSVKIKALATLLQDFFLIFLFYYFCF